MVATIWHARSMPHFVASLPIETITLDQVRSDLIELNAAVPLTNGEVPLVT